MKSVGVLDNFVDKKGLDVINICFLGRFVALICELLTYYTLSSQRVVEMFWRSYVRNC